MISETYYQTINVQNFKINLLIFIYLLSFTQYASASSDITNDAIEAGRKTYNRHCELCHGKHADGNGRYQSILKHEPANLTKLTDRNDGNFPWITLYKIIDGTDLMLAHGTREMPIWGERFDLNNWGEGNWNRGKTNHSKTIARGRIFELLLFLDFIQK